MSELLSASRLVVSQKPKLVELTNQYTISSPDGRQLGFVQQEGQSTLRKVLRFFTRIDQFLTHHLAIYDVGGAKLLHLTRPSKVFKSRILVADGSGRQVGEIVQQNVFGKIRFDLVAGGQKAGEVRAENWRAWDFAIVDPGGREVGRIDKKFVGVVKGLFTTADNYVVDIAPDLQGDLRLLTVAAASAVDLALKQDDRGVSVTDFLGG